MKLDLLHQLTAINEDMAPMAAPDRKINNVAEFEQTIEEFSRRFDAARRALGIVNRLPDGPDKKKHAKRVMTNMNVFRNYVNVLMRQLEAISQ